MIYILLYLMYVYILYMTVDGILIVVFLKFDQLGSLSGKGFDFINGFTFLERFYSVYDTTNNRVGIATTPNTYSTTN